MRIIVFLVLMLASFFASADIIYSNPTITVVVTPAKCPDSMKTHRWLKGKIELYSLGGAMIGNKRQMICATLVMQNSTGDLYVHVIYEDGYQGVIPYDSFRTLEPLVEPT